VSYLTSALSIKAVRRTKMLQTIYQRTLGAVATVLIVAAYVQCLFPVTTGLV